VRGDIEVNEAKLRKVVLLRDLEMARPEEIQRIGAVPGFAAAVGIDFDAVELIVDPSVVGSGNLVCGANEVDFHLTGFDFQRDVAAKTDKFRVTDIASVRQGDGCPHCQTPLDVSRGVEVGNIFQLGTKYTASMNHTYLDEAGKAQTPVMGCYGLGVGRLMATVIENHHDQYGPLWPITIAPFEVHICALNYGKPEIKVVADRIYKQFGEAGISVLMDDTDMKAGHQFADADLIGCPFRVTISPKTVEAGVIELGRRGVRESERVPMDGCLEVVRERIAAEYRRF
jgi:prolyl-tRNA synthetase